MVPKKKTKKVKTLPTKSLSSKQANGVKGGHGILPGPPPAKRR